MEITTMTIATRIRVDAVAPLRSTAPDLRTPRASVDARGTGQGIGVSGFGGTDTRVVDGGRLGYARTIAPSTPFAVSDVVPPLGRPPV